jgi:iron complex outermembrane recepter protein
MIRPTALLAATALAVAPPVAAAQRPASPADSARADSLRPVRRLETVAVTAIRGAGDAPISQTTIDRATLERSYHGQDVPLLLQGAAPSLTSYAETGTYWGYSYLRLRGIDQSRINLSLDGIPLNDPEDQVLYFADFPDLANSLQSVQVQRGVGTTGTGTAAYAGSINLETIPLATMARGSELQVGGGSFGTRRASAEYHSGLLPSRFAFYGRMSALATEGYRHHSDALGRSAFASAGWFGDRDIVKLTATAGLFRDTMAYYAATEADLARDRRVNPLEPQVGDQFGERLAALNYTRLLGPASSISTTVYRLAASGHYDVFIDPTTLWDFHLDFTWYGVTSAWSWSRGGVRLNAGLNANDYARDHFARQRADGLELYRNTGHKDDASAFAKAAWETGRLTLFGDLQGRWARFRYEPDRASGIDDRSIDWRFVNPKVGLTWRASDRLSAYTTYGLNSREPARSDMFAGLDNLDTSNVEFVGELRRVRPERVHDVEAGLGWEGAAASLRANLFAMQFRDEIAPIGALSYLGTPLRKNVSRSWRRGLEVDGRWQAHRRLSLAGSLTLMRGRIDAYRDDASGVTYQDVEPLLTPRVLASHRADFALGRGLTLGVAGRYSGRSYLANTGDSRFILPPSYALDGSVAWMRGQWGLSLLVNNMGDTRRYSSGYTDGTTSYYFVMPPRNILLTATLGL